ncbi:MAG TPA: hypothetical protein DEA80_09410 [Afipia sp.]|uniref:hypothetical protein n=1 Tax=unclassified Afipia TaxID=2642050 RepID=UPI00046583B9|nr:MULTISPECIES: hypothetical protein [unclassified Afipia]MAH71995.1 hypothetical protein [Afipia sp.]OUX59024.1 MAG: hypothetical protein CBB64_22575 [Afipia sp. TMED4]HAO43041.1 hypothetical protein [Afipia sp.]HAP10613.1 hypothetical protein [Afipia sp.]HAP48808.1 hypothetical protein [Afipia sp.]|tara:strand:- start:88 stop:483 length:396 start_codon:yes stop_codon:yes gene_type:complete
MTFKVRLKSLDGATNERTFEDRADAFHWAKEGRSFIGDEAVSYQIYSSGKLIAVKRRDTADKAEHRVRMASAFLGASLTVIILYAILISEFEFWGLILGWIPAGTAAVLAGYAFYHSSILLRILRVIRHIP